MTSQINDAAQRRPPLDPNLVERNVSCPNCDRQFIPVVASELAVPLSECSWILFNKDGWAEVGAEVARVS